MTANLVTRRVALKYVGVITLAASSWPQRSARAATLPGRGYGTDPNLLKRTVTWPLTLNSSQLATLAELSDIILPAEPPHPSARAIGVHDFLDEWVSAPYPQMHADRTVILRGLAMLEDTIRAERGVGFAELEVPQQIALFDRLCGTEAMAEFWVRLIELVCDGYYTTREGHAAIGYVGNVALAEFPGPPAEVVAQLRDSLSRLP